MRVNNNIDNSFDSYCLSNPTNFMSILHNNLTYSKIKTHYLFWGQKENKKKLNAQLFLHFPALILARKSQCLENPPIKTDIQRACNPLMQLCFFVSVILFFGYYGFCKPDIHVGHQVSIAVPGEYDVGFIGRAFVLEANQMEPNFKAALSIEAVNGKYSCSLEVFLGDVKVWNSGHYSRFFVSEECVLELTEDGDLRLKGPRNRVGWRTGTSGQGVEVKK